MPSSYDFAKVDGQNTETLNEVLNNLNVASISISENDNTILEESLLASSSVGIQSVLQKVFPQSVNTIDVNGKNVTYSVNLTNNVFYSLILCTVAIFSIFLASITTASSCAKKTVSQMIKLKDAILNKNYDEIPFTDLSKVLASNEEKFTTELNGAKKKIEELQVSNARDPLTGLYNRSEFKNVFEKCFKKGLATTKTHALGFVRASAILIVVIRLVISTLWMLHQSSKNQLKRFLKLKHIVSMVQILRYFSQTLLNKISILSILY